MNVRLENLQLESTATNYVSFLSQSRRPHAHASETASIRSVSSVRSVMSGMSSLWSNLGLGAGASAARTERQKAALEADLIYLYSAFTKIPCLRLMPDPRARLISGYEEFPFDTAVPLHAFKNLSTLEIINLDFRQFYGWDRLADQLRSLSVKRAGVDDLEDLLVNIVLDDMDRRRRRSSKPQVSPISTWTATSPKQSPSFISPPGSPDQRTGDDDEVRIASMMRGTSDVTDNHRTRPRSNSPMRPRSGRANSSHSHLRGGHKITRSGSGSSSSSLVDAWYHPRNSASNLAALGIVPASKWRFLRHLAVADNGLTTITSSSLAPLAETLHSLDLSTNLFAQIPDALANLTALRALNLSNCLIDSLHSLTRHPLPAITALNLRGNRLGSLAGIEKLYSMERVDLRDNQLTDPTELARLTGVPEIREIWVAGNPFTKTHGGYRVAIFNLFRKTPGYREDILIDGSLPGYTERRQLVDRVAERPSVPVIKAVELPVPIIKPAERLVPVIKAVERPMPVIQSPNPLPQTDSRPAGEQHLHIRTPVVRYDRSIPATTLNEPRSDSARRRKSTKRRIVDLSTPESKPVVHFEQAIDSPSVSPSHVEPPLDTTTTRAGPTSSEVPRLSSSTVPVLRPAESLTHQGPLNVAEAKKLLAAEPAVQNPEQPGKAVAEKAITQPPDWNANGQLYRQKIEALRNDIGTGWLSVLSEESGHSGHSNHPSYHTSESLRPPLLTHTSSQTAVHSGRTLG